MERDYKVRGDVVRYHRKRKHWSQQELAVAAGMSLGQVSRIESGVIESPQFKTLEKLAQALGLDSDDLIEWLMPLPASDSLPRHQLHH